jgi:UDP-glucose 4-epimerase
VSEVIALDNLSSGRPENLSGAENVKFLEGSVIDTALMDEAISDAHAVVHLAARPSVPLSLADPVATHEANATGTLCVLEAARRCPLARRPLVIVASSSSVYGANPAMPKREDAVPMPASPYAASKLASEAYSLAYARSFALPVLVFRFFNVFGPLQAADHAYAAVVPAFVSAALRGEPLTVHGTGTQTRDFTYVGSVVAILIDALRRGLTDPEPVNLAFGSRISVLELAAALESVVGHSLHRRHIEARAGDVEHSQADTDRLKRLFPKAVPVPLEVGLRLTVEWARSAWS